jgi:hypothetical protein
MPKKVEKRLKKQAKKLHLSGEAFDKYVFGALQKATNWKPHGRGKKVAKPGGK